VADAMRQSPKLVTVFGGSGFLGRHVVRALAKRGYRIRVAVRRPDLANFLYPIGVVGQIQTVQANLRYDDSIARAVERADAVVNCVGILAESGRQTFDEVQAEGARAIARSVGPGTPLVHVSAIGADAASDSAYARTKAAGEAAVLEACSDAVVLRPSLMFGPGDSFFNRFGALARALPVLPIAGADTRFQPVFVGNVAEIAARGVDGLVQGGRIYELGGPEIRTLRELVEYVLAVTERRRTVVPLPLSAARLQARVLEIVNALTLGLLPETLRLTRDQVALLQHDNVVSPEAIAEGRTLEGLGIVPESFEAIAPTYLQRFRKTGQFETMRAV
jgi:uncharacterized protein YbjT (DUF2867 family)